jgi:hypothetical protein
LNLNEFILNFPRSLDGGSYFSKLQGLNQKKTGLKRNHFELRLDGGLILKNIRGLSAKRVGQLVVACVNTNVSDDIIATWRLRVGAVHHCLVDLRG